MIPGTDREFLLQVAFQLFERSAEAGSFQKLQQLVLPNELLVAGHGALLKNGCRDMIPKPRPVVAEEGLKAQFRLLPAR